MSLPSFLGYRTRLSLLPAKIVLLCLTAGVVLFLVSIPRYTAAEARELHVAAAADLQPVMPVLAETYQAKTGIHLIVSYGSSGSLVTQIENGAPFDLFFGADFVYPERIVAGGLTDSAAPVPYAQGTLVLWARKDSPLQPLSIDKLEAPALKSLAIADETHAPYGRAAVSALQKLRLYDALKPRLSIAENVAQAGQYAVTGNSQAALISLTLASSDQYRNVGSYVLVPKVYPEIRQCAVVLKRSKDLPEAHRFLDWVLSAEVQGGLARLGLQPVR